MFQLSPSILAADFSKLGEQIQDVKNAGAGWLHIDVMDGVFVPSISFGMPVIKSIRKITDLFFDVHLMVQNPERYVKEFAKSGADLITVHVEACENISETMQLIRQNGCKVGLSINPETPVEAVEPYMKEVDLILVMSVHPGFGGQKFIPETLDKIREIRARLTDCNPNCYLETDGGIYHENVAAVLEAGATVIVAGTAVFEGNIRENIRQFYEIAKR